MPEALSRVTAVLAMSAFAVTALGDDLSPPVVDETAVPGMQTKPLWEAGIGAVAGALTDYPGSDQYRVRALPLPYFVYRGDVVRSDANGARVRAATGIVEWELSGGGSLSSNSTGGARAGMPKLDYLLEVGPKAKITLVRPTDTSRLLLDLPVRGAFSTDFSSRLQSRGALFAPDLTYEERAIFGSQWSGRASIGGQFATAGLQRFYYQVEPEYARAGRPAYDARAGYLGATFGLTALRQLTPRFTIFLGMDVDSYQGAANVDSPLVRARSDLDVAFGFAWSLGQSKRRVTEPH
jgi:outer membrane scaffolding protein for murein synthesis (MipA/OmpV family)